MLRRLVITALLTIFLSTSAFAQMRKWQADAMHSRVGFTVRHLMISNVAGNFGDFSVAVEADPQDLTKATVDAAIQVKSINTGVAKRDDHVRSPDFFGAAKFPAITFKSKKVAKLAQGQLKITGDLTIHGVTKPAVLDVTGLAGPMKDPMGGGMRVGMQASTKIKRKDFGVGLKTGGAMLGDEVTIQIDLELVQAK
jgi:polyisoprenoid-binding protein YceI